MISDETAKQVVYQYLLKSTQKRLAQAIPGSEEDAFGHLSLAASVECAVSAERRVGFARGVCDDIKSPSGACR